MLDVSSHGRVAPKTKTINVNANLLSQRLAEREHIREWIRKRLIFIGLCIVVAVIALPPLHRVQRKALANAAQLKKKEAAIAQQVIDLQKQQDTVKPAVASEHLLSSIGKNSREFLGHVFLLLDNVSPAISLSTFKANMNSGMLELGTQADAINYQAAQVFVAECERTPRQQGTYVSSMRSNSEVGDEGVSFDFSQRVKLAP